jgi:hypothetical protein
LVPLTSSPRRRRFREAIALALLLGTLSAALYAPPALAAPRCSAAPDPGGCPFMGPRGKAALFSRCAGPKGLLTHQPTPLGNTVCDAVLATKTLVRTLGTNAQAKQNEVKAGMEARLDKVKGAVPDANLIAAYTGARSVVQSVANGLKDYANDPQCGVKGTIENAKTFFETRVQNAKAFADLGAQSAQAAIGSKRAVDEAKDAKKAGEALVRKYPQKTDANVIAAITEAFQRDVQIAVRPDFAPPPPGAQSERLYPLVIAVGTCGSGLVTLAKSAANYMLSGSSTIVCPATAGASCVAAAATGINGTVKAVWGSIKSLGGCGKTTTNWIGNKEGYRARWQELFGGDAAATRPGDLDAALVRARGEGKKLGPGAAPDVSAVTAPMERSIGHVRSWSAVKNQGIAPLRQQFGDSRWSEAERGLNTVVACWGKAQTLAKRVGGEAHTGLEEIAQAAADLDAVEKAGASIRQARQRAIDAAGSAAAQLDGIRAQASALHVKLLGVPYGARLEAGKVGRHLVTLADRPAEVTQLADRAKALRLQAQGIVAGALKRGDDAFAQAARKDLDTAVTQGASALRGFQSGMRKLKAAGVR